MVDVIVLDTGKAYIETITGIFNQGKFTYKTGSFKILGLGEEKSFDMNYADTYQEGRDRKSIYIFDGKDYKQQPLGNLTLSTSLADYSRDLKIADLAKQNILHKPESLQNILTTLLVLMTLIAAIGAIFAANNATNAIKTFGTASNKTSNTNTQLVSYLIKKDNVSDAIDNETLRLFTGYINNPSG